MTVHEQQNCVSQSCRVCRGLKSDLWVKDAKDYITEQLFEVRQCSFCRVAFTHPQPESMHQFYPSYYRQYGRVAQAILKFLYNWHARSWVKSLGFSGRALEIGCGNGWMLRALRQRGWEVVGNERTVQSTLFASTVNDLPVFVGQLDALKPLAQFDLIVLFQVLEHLPDPLSTLRQCTALLKEGGTLVVAVPNLKSWQAQWTGSSWFHLDVPRHLFHFSPASLSYAMELAGLSVSNVRFSSLEHDPYGWLQSLLNQAGFKQNLLTRLLMGADRGRLAGLAKLEMGLLSLCLLGPCLLLALCSWISGAGAVVELRAAKRRPPGHTESADDDPKAAAQIDQSFYDAIWVAWKDMQRYAPAPRYLRRMVMKELARLEFNSVLDMGCGEGTLLKMIADAYPHVALSGSELSETALKYCREQLPQANLFHLDVMRDEPSAISYDLIILVQVLEHLEDDLAALRKLKTMCRGYALISVPGGDLDDHGRRMGHYRHYTKESLVLKMEQAGFRVVRVFSCGWPVHSVCYRQLIRHLPQGAVEQVGLGSYGWKKRAVMTLADMTYRLNLPFVGTEVFAIGVPDDPHKL